MCVFQAPGCFDAGVSSLPNLWVPVNGPEEVPGHHPLRPVHGPYASEGNFVFNKRFTTSNMCPSLTLILCYLLELPLPDLRGHLLLSLSSSPPPGPETSKPPDWQQRCYQTCRLRPGSGFWCSCQGLHTWGEESLSHSRPGWTVLDGSKFWYFYFYICFFS